MIINFLHIVQLLYHCLVIKDQSWWCCIIKLYYIVQMMVSPISSAQ